MLDGLNGCGHIMVLHPGSLLEQVGDLTAKDPIYCHSALERNRKGRTWVYRRGKERWTSHGDGIHRNEVRWSGMNGIEEQDTATRSGKRSDAKQSATHDQ